MVDEKTKRELLVRQLVCSIEDLYNMPGKPETVKEIDMRIAKNRIYSIVSNKSQNDINIIIKSLKEIPHASPSSKEQIEVIVGILEEYCSKEQDER